MYVMRTSRFQFLTVILALVMMVGVGCYNDYVIFPDGGEITGDVTFSADILPIFNKDCSLSGCHVSGSQAPDLSSANAYTSLTTGNFVDPASAEDSELYRWMKGLETLPMPPSGSNASNAAKVLAWIKQGAQNN
jgi:hypothetical protein